jgi:hypothetical protein
LFLFLVIDYKDAYRKIKFFEFIFCHLLFILTLFSHMDKKKRKKNFFLVHILDQTKRTYMDRVSFLYIWTNRQIYALRPCIYLATSRRGKKIDEQERGRERGRRRRRKSKNKSTAINLLLCRQRHSTFYFFIRMVLPLFSSLSFSLNYDGGLHWVLQITD